ncbi:MAG: 30S ribosomal protein S20 [Bacillota bacterium]|nr:30S ribosomal protein S20 [Bacillota bacterium]
MPNIKSAIKRVKITEKKTRQNRMKKSALRKQIRSLDRAIADGVDQTADLLRDTQKRIDQAVSQGRMHRNTAARRKSRLAKAVNRQSQA